LAFTDFKHAIRKTRLVVLFTFIDSYTAPAHYFSDASRQVQPINTKCVIALFRRIAVEKKLSLMS